MTQLNIVSAHPLHPTIERDVLCTPRLIDEGTRRAVEAYKEGNIWRARDDSYDPAGQTYQLVRVEVTAGERMPWDQR